MKQPAFLIVLLVGWMTNAPAQVVQIPATLAWPITSGDQTAPGFRVRIAQADASEVGFVRLEASSTRAEAQLAGALVNPATRLTYTDVSNKTGFNADGTFHEAGVIDYEQAGSATSLFPGVPEGAASTDDFALEAIGYLELKTGTYTMIVNSDDGFQVSASRDPRDWFGRIKVGEYEGGRSQADSSFSFSTAQDGLYGFRILYYEAGGGANLSWFAGENRVLINDLANGGIKAFQAITSPRLTYVRYVTPAPEAVGVSRSAVLQLQLGDGDNVQVDQSSIELSLNGLKVAPTIAKTGAVTKITFAPSALLPSLSTNKVRLSYRDTATPPNLRTEEYAFKVTQYASITLPAPIYFENFDATPEGSLPAGWSETSYTDQSGSSPDLDFGNLDSAAYAKWTAVNVDRFKGSFVTYSNPDNPASWENDYKRVLSFNPANIVNDQLVSELAKGRFLFADSGYRNGTSQVLYLFTPDFNLAAQGDVYLSFHSLWEQNQDSVAAVEYSIDGGQKWLPILYMPEPADVVKDAAGKIDAVATLTQEQGDSPSYTDPRTGETKGGTYGAFIGAEITPDLAPFISPRTQDDPVDSKRVELFRLSNADHQAKVRFRFAHAGTDSWYFAIDDFGLYSIPTSGSTILAHLQGSSISLGWSGGPGLTLQKAGSLSNPAWEDVPGTLGASTFTEAAASATAFYRLVKR